MAKDLHRVTTRQVAFLREQGFDLSMVVGDPPVGDRGVRMLVVESTHPWASRSSCEYEGDSTGGVITLLYPDEQTREAAMQARADDFSEMIGQMLTGERCEARLGGGAVCGRPAVGSRQDAPDAPEWSACEQHLFTGWLARG